ncbi:hypothetical protein KJJ36_13865 [Staphylococcus pseudoxylosus]|uniref:hypothetical protein n=1 Tax=Staphylococcus pseudoxylosus TaxID=2282419 RepID=UPI001F253453|nr:hypothetical protein [Staphylococcus pseudoxylosus]MCE5003453.1 hypothetical protein [Staphylococcus pseudoxylosus]
MPAKSNVKGLKYPLEIFKTHSVIVKLLNGDVKKGVFSSHTPFDIKLITNIGTKQAPEKGLLVIHKKDICSVERNPKKLKRKNMHKRSGKHTAPKKN